MRRWSQLSQFFRGLLDDSVSSHFLSLLSALHHSRPSHVFSLTLPDYVACKYVESVRQAFVLWGCVSCLYYPECVDVRCASSTSSTLCYLFGLWAWKRGRHRDFASSEERPELFIHLDWIDLKLEVLNPLLQMHGSKITKNVLQFKYLLIGLYLWYQIFCWILERTLTIFHFNHFTVLPVHVWAPLSSPIRRSVSPGYGL